MCRDEQAARRWPEWHQLMHGCGSDAETSESSLWSLAPASAAEQRGHEPTVEPVKCELQGDGYAPGPSTGHPLGPTSECVLPGGACCDAPAKRPRAPSYARTLHVGPQDSDGFFDAPMEVRRPGPVPPNKAVCSCFARSCLLSRLLVRLQAKQALPMLLSLDWAFLIVWLASHAGGPRSA